MPTKPSSSSSVLNIRDKSTLKCWSIDLRTAAAEAEAVEAPHPLQPPTTRHPLQENTENHKMEHKTAVIATMVPGTYVRTYVRTVRIPGTWYMVLLLAVHE